MDKMKPFAKDTSRAPVSQRKQIFDDSIPQDRKAMVKAVIDDKTIEVPRGTTILEAAKLVNIKIPTLCQHDDLCLAGVCRVCIVEV
ncbi:MAG: (2Fe-2S)-binding protein, partial [Candidatus Omnitrophica bacterium]|nr:(2Fe-2S)-binding protein [Candidatus Omnitrophota bacterium]